MKKRFPIYKVNFFSFFFLGASLYDLFEPSICSQYNEAFVQLLDITIIIE